MDIHEAVSVSVPRVANVRDALRVIVEECGDTPLSQVAALREVHETLAVALSAPDLHADPYLSSAAAILDLGAAWRRPAPRRYQRVSLACVIFRRRTRGTRCCTCATRRNTRCRRLSPRHMVSLLIWCVVQHALK